MMTDVKMENVVNYLLNNVDELRSLVSEMNGWDGSFEEFNFMENDEDFFNTYFDGNPMEAVRAAQYGDYNYTDDYVRFNGYGNLESLSEYDVERELKDNVEDIADRLLDLHMHLSLDPELEDIILEDEDEEDEDEE